MNGLLAGYRHTYGHGSAWSHTWGLVAHWVARAATWRIVGVLPLGLAVIVGAVALWLIAARRRHSATARR